MIRTNLSTRPFYNERAVHLWLLALGAIVAVITVFNISRVIGYSQSDTALATQASRDEARVAEVRREAARLRATVNLQQIELASTEARVANQLIDRRTFSWTELFNQFEVTFPDNVRVTSVRPQLDEQGGVQLTITVVARSVDDVDELMRNLEETGRFRNFLSVEERFNDDGLLVATLAGTYTPMPAQTVTTDKKAP
ncbi:MAG TPA: PilN domain-containing protein [Vicinamibacterales bacterium]|jgi:Tfp pilus assembly protein PilN|nr:PilN domain-containing protein [Vicinamibacterales bacterium]